MKTILAAALLTAIAAPAFAANAPAEQIFTRDGETYVYTKTQTADRVVLQGHRLPSGAPFKLFVSGSRITGISNGTPVAFTIHDAQSKIADTQLASN